MANDGQSQLILFTSIDGSAYDDDGDQWDAAKSDLRDLTSDGVQIVFCSWRTRSELLALQEEVGVDAPFIAENGSAAFFPTDYLSQRVPGAVAAPNAYGSADALDVVELGLPAVRIRELIREVRSESGFPLRGFSDMSLDEIAELTGLDHDAAARAAEREYSETVEIDLDDEQWNEFVFLLAERGLACTTGWDYVTVTSALTDAGRAVRLVTEMIRRERGGAMSIGIGLDSDDASMLQAVDRPYFLTGADEEWGDLEVEEIKNVSNVRDVLTS